MCSSRQIRAAREFAAEHGVRRLTFVTVYFAFSDECGDYRQLRTPGFQKAHPFYVRSTVRFAADAWRSLEASVADLKKALQLPMNEEIKWSFLWSLEKHRQKNEPVPKGRDYFFLKDTPPERLQAFVRRCLEHVAALPECRVLFTVTDNCSCPRHSSEDIYKWHLQEALQRVQMDMEAGPNNLCVLFFDPMSADRDRFFRDAYVKLYQAGDRYKKYTCLKDSLNMEHSHHSVGVQCADYLAGAFTSMLRGYAFGVQLYRDVIKGFIRRGQFGAILGYGARLVPRGKDYESVLAHVLRQN